jgi:apolipoprotein D and lipocalin family protein
MSSQAIRRARSAPAGPRRGWLLLGALVLTACSSPPSGALPGAGPLTSVASFEAERYLGLWYEIAKYPVRFEEGLVGITAQYAQRGDGKLLVVNSGREATLDGELDQSEAVAWVPDPEHPARLKVQFFWPFSGDYWVIALDPDYGWAVVGEPKRRYLWILARTPELSAQTYADVLARITELGYDVARLERVPQPPVELPPDPQVGD